MKNAKKLLILALLVCCCAALFIVAANAMAVPDAPEKAGWYQLSEDDWMYSKDGSAWVTDNWAKVGGKWYYFDDEGLMYRDANVLIDGSWYYFKPNGAMLTGWYERSIDYDEYNSSWDDDLEDWVIDYDDTYPRNWTFWTYARSNGKLAIGWEKIGSYWYFVDDVYYYDEDLYVATPFTAGGDMLCQGAYDCLKKNGLDPENDDNWGLYLFGSGGRLQTGTGWRSLSSSYKDDYNGNIFYYTTWFYLKNGTVATGWQKIGGYWYYFDPYDGYMYSGGPCLVEEGDSETVYCFAASGKLVENGWFSDDELYYDAALKKKLTHRTWYYMKDGAAVTGWQTIGGKEYYFDEDYFYMHTDEVELPYDASDEAAWLDPHQAYALGSDGARVVTGWARMDVYSYDFDLETGETEESVTTYWFYLRNGQFLRDGIYTIGSARYHFGEAGVMSTDTVIPDFVDGKLTAHIVTASGKILENGWYSWEDAGKTFWYYVKNGSLVINDWAKVGSYWYCFDEDGLMMSDLVTNEAKGCEGMPVAFDKSGRWVRSGWFKYVPGDGCVYWFYIKDGYAATGWQKIGSYSYYFNEYGVMYCNGDTLPDGGWIYTFDENGHWTREKAPD